MDIVNCINLTIGYERQVVLANIDLTLQRGVFLPFVGPNGAGKTTLLKAILGLLRPISGNISILCDKKSIGYVSQQKAIDSLYPVSVLDIVLMGAYRQMKWHGTGIKKFKQNAMKVLERFNLAEHSHKVFNELSGGMRQKVIVARALMGENDLLIMDEPTTELDHNSQKDLINALKDLVDKEGKTVFMVHHGLDMIANLTETVCFVNEGKARLIPVREARF